MLSLLLLLAVLHHMLLLSHSLCCHAHGVDVLHAVDVLVLVLGLLLYVLIPFMLFSYLVSVLSLLSVVPTTH